MSTFLPFALPDLGQEEIDEVVDSLKNGWITTGPKVAQFEKNFAEYLGVKHALAVNSATAGLHLALDAIGLERDDIVITTAYTFTATAEVVRYFDAHPLFCDIEEDSYNLCPRKLVELLESLSPEKREKVKAIIPVHIAGLACDMTSIMEIAKRFNLKVIEDAAHALPSTHNGELIGGFGDLTVYSFYATKTITTAEGGMVVTNNEKFKERIKVMRIHGFSKDAWNRYSEKKASWFYEVVAPGYKYNMTDISASMGLHQLKKVDQFFEKRNKIARKYNQAFSKMDNVQTPHFDESEKHSFHLYMIRVPSDVRDQFIDHLKELGVGTSVHFIPLHLHPYWKNKYNLNDTDFPIALKNFQKSISLPIYTKMSEEDTDRVIDAVKKVASELC